MVTLPKGTHILSGAEFQRLRSFFSSAVWNSSHLDAYAIFLQKGPLSLVKADFRQRIDPAFFSRPVETSIVETAMDPLQPTTPPWYETTLLRARKRHMML